MADVFHSPKDYSPIYVSKKDPSTILNLATQLNNDDRYSKRVTSGITVRERFATQVICIDCDDSICNAGFIPLWHDKPMEIKCLICGYVYHPSQ